MITTATPSQVMARPAARFTLPEGDLTHNVDQFFAYSERHGNTEAQHLPWDQLRPELLTPVERKAVQFVTYIEDHLPGYFADYARIFPIDADTPLERCAFNRALYHFTVRWAYEEDRHAHALATYQWRAGITPEDQLSLQLVTECRKPFKLAYLEPLQVFTYTLIQEKATQLYYQQLAHCTREPVLKVLMTRLARDEARHFAFFSKLVERYVELHGEATVPCLRDVVENFRMPLSDTLTQYWRLSLQAIAAADGYDYTEAFASLLGVLQRAGLKGQASVNSLADLVRQVRGL